MSKTIPIWIKVIGSIIGIIGIIWGIIVSIPTLPGILNDFFDEYPGLRERWLNAEQWTGMYSSTFPEGVVNMEELELSRESDVIISLNYSAEEHSIHGSIYSGTFCERGLFKRLPIYGQVLIEGMPQILSSNRLEVNAYDFVDGRYIPLDEIRIERDNPQGIITITSKGRLLSDSLRLAPDTELIEEELDIIRCGFIEEILKCRDALETIP